MRETLTGTLFTGLGEARAFTRLDWARRAFMENFAIDPYPGTVNLRLDDPAERAKWREVKARPGVILVSPDRRWCNARCYRARIGGRIEAAVVIPAVEAYPADQVELVAAVAVREALGLADGDPVRIEIDLDGAREASRDRE